jgi:hypothetical protein
MVQYVTHGLAACKGRPSARCVAGRLHSQIDLISMQIRSTWRSPGPYVPICLRRRIKALGSPAPITRKLNSISRAAATARPSRRASPGPSRSNSYLEVCHQTEGRNSPLEAHNHIDEFPDRRAANDLSVGPAVGATQSRVAPKKMKAPENGLTMENSAVKVSRRVVK